MIAPEDLGSSLPKFASGQRLRLPGEAGTVVVDLVAPQPQRVDIYVKDGSDAERTRGPNTARLRAKSWILVIARKMSTMSLSIFRPNIPSRA